MIRTPSEFFTAFQATLTSRRCPICSQVVQNRRNCDASSKLLRNLRLGIRGEVGSKADQQNKVVELNIVNIIR